MYSIKKAAELSGVPAATLRAWENRYSIPTAARSESGYRIYDDQAIADIRKMQQLVDQGWTHSTAAAEVLRGKLIPVANANAASAGLEAELSDKFFEAAEALDAEALGSVIDQIFARSGFEYAIDHSIASLLTEVGRRWSIGEMQISVEHLVSSALMRRLSAFFESSSTVGSGPGILVGTPAGSYHEIGSLALATALKRRGLKVIYLGCNVPPESWVEAIQRSKAQAVALSVVMPDDAKSAEQCVAAIRSSSAKTLIAAGGGAAQLVEAADLRLDGSLLESSRVLADAVFAGASTRR